MTHRSARLSVALASLMALTAGAIRAQTSYTIQDLGSIPGANRIIGTGINSSGQASARSAQNSSTGHALFFNGSSLIDLGTLGGAGSEGTGINNAGWVVGWAQNRSGALRPALWKNGAAAIDITKKNGRALAVNNVLPNPQVTGSIGTAAFVWQNGTTKNLPFSSGNAINDSGQIAGRNGNSACAWSLSTGVVPLTSLSANPGSEALGINNAGTVVVGYSPNEENVRTAVRWSGSAILSLGVPSGWAWTQANGINDAGVIVGNSGSGIAWRWDATSNMIVDLNTLISPESGWVLGYAAGINSSGQIVGFGTVTGDVWEHAFILTPVVP